MSEKCGRCDGCGKVANTRRAEPWSAWLNLPLKSAAAVTAGIVRPMTCPACGGTGVHAQEALPDPVSDHLVVMGRADLEALEWSGLYICEWMDEDHPCCPACHGLMPGSRACRYMRLADEIEAVYEEVEDCPLNAGIGRQPHGHLDMPDGRRCPVDRALRPTATVNPES